LVVSSPVCHMQSNFEPSHFEPSQHAFPELLADFKFSVKKSMINRALRLQIKPIEVMSSSSDEEPAEVMAAGEKPGEEKPDEKKPSEEKPGEEKPDGEKPAGEMATTKVRRSQ